MLNVCYHSPVSHRIWHTALLLCNFLLHFKRHPTQYVYQTLTNDHCTMNSEHSPLYTVQLDTSNRTCHRTLHTAHCTLRKHTKLYIAVGTAIFFTGVLLIFHIFQPTQMWQFNWWQTNKIIIKIISVHTMFASLSGIQPLHSQYSLSMSPIHRIWR